MSQQSVDAKTLLVSLHKEVTKLSTKVEELEANQEVLVDSVYILLSFYLDNLNAVEADEQVNEAIEHVLTLLLALRPERAARMLISIAEASDQETFDDVCDRLEDVGIDVDGILRERAAQRAQQTGLESGVELEDE